MANHASAIKRARQSEKRRQRNRAIKTRIKTNINALDEAISAGNKEAATAAFAACQKFLAKASTGGTLHARNVSRRIGRLAKRVQALG